MPTSLTQALWFSIANPANTLPNILTFGEFLIIGTEIKGLIKKKREHKTNITYDRFKKHPYNNHIFKQALWEATAKRYITHDIGAFELEMLLDNFYFLVDRYRGRVNPLIP